MTKTKGFGNIWLAVIITGAVVATAAWLFWDDLKEIREDVALHTDFSSDKIDNQKFMRLQSLAFKQGETMPSQYTCDGEDVNPQLSWQDIPTGAKSLVLIVDDPDAPSGDWVHWTLWNIPINVSMIAENSVPDGAVQGKTDFGKTGWNGPCPPSGMHKYQFKLYAIDTVLSLDISATKKDIENVIRGHILAEAQLIGKYSRRK